MKKLVLFLVVGMFLISGVWAESCEVARPYYGSVNCKELGSWSNEILKSDGQSWVCEVPNCKITGMNMDDFGCTGFGTTSRLNIKINGVPKIECSNTFGNDLSIECQEKGLDNYGLVEGDVVQIDFSCNLGEPEDNPQIGFKYKTIALQMHYDSGENFQAGTEFCQVNSIWNIYGGKQLNNNDVLKSMSISGSNEFSSDKGLSSIPSENPILEPKQLKVGQGYWFIYEWVTRPELNVKDYQGVKVWCNSIDKSLTKLEQLTTTGNKCYLIPAQRLSQQVECCSSGECTGIYNDQDIYCTDDFKCGYTKSCEFDYDCSSISSSCESTNGKYNLISSICDKNKLDDYGKGKCVSTKEEVKCCNGNDGGVNSCGSEQYCDYEEGCKGVFRDCPSNSCCLSGGDYKEKICDVGQCCTSQGSFIGLCAEDCSKLDSEDLDSLSSSGNLSPSKSGSSTGKTILIIFLILIVGSAGFFIYAKNKEKKKRLKQKVKKEIQGHSKKCRKCRKCGSLISPKSKFCTKCGRRV